MTGANNFTTQNDLAVDESSLENFETDRIHSSEVPSQVLKPNCGQLLNDNSEMEAISEQTSTLVDFSSVVDITSLTRSLGVEPTKYPLIPEGVVDNHLGNQYTDVIAEIKNTIKSGFDLKVTMIIISLTLNYHLEYSTMHNLSKPDWVKLFKLLFKNLEGIMDQIIMLVDNAIPLVSYNEKYEKKTSYLQGAPIRYYLSVIKTSSYQSLMKDAYPISYTDIWKAVDVTYTSKTSMISERKTSPKSKKTTRSENTKKTCIVCGKFGHDLRNCFKLKNAKRRGSIVIENGKVCTLDNNMLKIGKGENMIDKYPELFTKKKNSTVYNELENETNKESSSVGDTDEKEKIVKLNCAERSNLVQNRKLRVPINEPTTLKTAISSPMKKFLENLNSSSHRKDFDKKLLILRGTGEEPMPITTRNTNRDILKAGRIQVNPPLRNVAAALNDLQVCKEDATNVSHISKQESETLPAAVTTNLRNLPKMNLGALKGDALGFSDSFTTSDEVPEFVEPITWGKVLEGLELVSTKGNPGPSGWKYAGYYESKYKERSLDDSVYGNTLIDIPLEVFLDIDPDFKSYIQEITS
ncbi:predicted protein [Lodderomyces elongisporus NRRL YB-4239]|uniref:CCHC-type domain-containing protein n=1 Tax=Lodderomyces elongisporus (strain ATCC 11503 / CBS 2605 / JCM 1781 / NBRC 1676 / NRRL YB-4239) TaxID=379508 RepID=A5E1T4_LODEL|nr:predicted protein [Lodderomyces elongisporus NRRL YB-4239]